MQLDLNAHKDYAQETVMLHLEELAILLQETVFAMSIILEKIVKMLTIPVLVTVVVLRGDCVIKLLVSVVALLGIMLLILALIANTLHALVTAPTQNKVIAIYQLEFARVKTGGMDQPVKQQVAKLSVFTEYV